jgi:hypothetical protein
MKNERNHEQGANAGTAAAGNSNGDKATRQQERHKEGADSKRPFAFRT